VPESGIDKLSKEYFFREKTGNLRGELYFADEEVKGRFR